MEQTTGTALVLASTSPFRQDLLRRLQYPFTVMAPDVVEDTWPGEDPDRLVRRLSRMKAEAVAAVLRSRGTAGSGAPVLVIGSDQVAVLDGERIGKPGDRYHAALQLQRASGRVVQFLTGLCLCDVATGRVQSDVVPCAVTFRALTGDQIERYLTCDEPFGCAGSFKSESLGIALLSRLEGPDPTALIGLPLIRLVDMLQHEGVMIP
jgi:septum formation protein